MVELPPVDLAAALIGAADQPWVGRRLRSFHAEPQQVVAAVVVKLQARGPAAAHMVVLEVEAVSKISMSYPEMS
jgi:hypothetical protein